jgi:2-hydroxychromene-2-carboxylate isomerase
MAQLSFDLYWSMRSPYCYLALDRMLEIERDYDVTVNLRPVYPIAVRDPDFFRVRASKHYRPYNLLDTARLAERHGIKYRRPVPDPIVQNLATGVIAEDQPYIRRITRLAQAAVRRGKGMAYLDQVSRLIWDGSTDNWHEGEHMAQALTRAGLPAADLLNEVETDGESLDAEIHANEAAQDAAGHGGVPLMVFDGEPFFGQDRIELLLWRLGQHGLIARQL